MEITVTLPDADVRWLDARAEDLGIRRSELIRQAIVAYRRRLEAETTTAKEATA